MVDFRIGTLVCVLKRRLRFDHSFLLVYLFEFFFESFKIEGMNRETHDILGLKTKRLSLDPDQPPKPTVILGTKTGIFTNSPSFKFL